MYSKSFKRKIRANTNVLTRKLYDSISHKLGRPKFVKSSKYMRDWKPISRKRDWRLDPPVVFTLGICIMCHGNIGYKGKHPIVNVPDGITLVKKNLGGCGNPSFGLYKIKFGMIPLVSKPTDISHKVKEYVNDSTLTTLTDFDRCVDKPSYDAFVSDKLSSPVPSCEIFHGPRFYSKLYSFKPYKSEYYTYTNNYIMFTCLSSSGLYKSINIVTCTQHELNDFFETVNAPITTDFMKLKKDREKKVIKLTTEDIFKLIEHARDGPLSITNVNILDLSCNTSINEFKRNPDIGY